MNRKLIKKKVKRNALSLPEERCYKTMNFKCDRARFCMTTNTEVKRMNVTMSLCRRRDCDDKFRDRTPRRLPSCDRLDRIQAGMVRNSTVTVESHWLDVMINIYRRCQHATAEPDCISLHVMWDNLHINWFWLKIINELGYSGYFK